MRKLRDVLRLTAAGLSSRKVAASLGMGASTVTDCLQRARAAGVGWPLPEEMTDAALESRLYPASTVLAEIKARRPQPDWPALHRELQLWVEAGIPPAVALQAATYNGARALRAEERMGSIRAGREASLVLVDGNPLEDIKRTEGIQILFFKGERVDRPDLFDQE